MNPLGVHALVWVGGWSAEEVRHAAKSTAAVGFDLLEVPVLDPEAVDIEMTRQTLAEHGLTATCSLGLDFTADVSSEDPDIAGRGYRRLEAALTVAAGIGSRYLGGVIYSALGKYPQPASAASRAHAVDALSRLAGKAAEHDVTLGLEVVNRYESNLINTAEQAMALLAEIGADNVVVHLDTYHMNIEETDFTAPVRICGDRLGYVHVGENNRGYLGTGTVNFAEFFAALREANYGGPVTFESFSSVVVHPSLSNALGVWRNLWDDGEDLARQALAFMRAGLGSG